MPFDHLHPFRLPPSLPLAITDLSCFYELVIYKNAFMFFKMIC